MFGRAVRTIAVAHLCLGVLAGSVLAEGKRFAFVVGNNEYENVVDLQKAVNDARSIGETLKGLGFDVTVAENLPRRDMNLKLQEFAAKIGRGDDAVFFYAGHGLQISGENILLPTDMPNARPGQEDFVKAEGVSVSQVLDMVRERHGRVAILILDACRNNPFRREGTRSLGGTRGLTGMSAPEGTFIMYSAGVGQEALDRLNDADPDPNSVFTRTLVPLLKTPGLKLTDMARQARRKVETIAASVTHEQRPAYYDEVTGEFYFAPGDEVAATDPGEASEGGEETPSGEATLWAAIEGSDKSADFEFYVRKFPKSRYAPVAELKIRQLKDKEAAAEKERQRLAMLANEQEEKSRRETGKADLLKWLMAPGYWAVDCDKPGGNIYRLDGSKIEYQNADGGTHGYANYSLVGQNTVRLAFIRGDGIHSDITQTIERIDDGRAKSLLVINGKANNDSVRRCDCKRVRDKAASEMCRRAY